MEWFKVYTYWGDAVDKLSDEEAGRLLKNIFAYTRFKESREGSGREDLLMTVVLPILQRDIEKYETTTAEEAKKKERRKERARQASLARWKPEHAGQDTQHPVECNKHDIACNEHNSVCNQHNAACNENNKHRQAGKNIEYKNQDTKNTEERNEICIAAETEEDGGCSSVLPPAVTELPVLTIPLVNGTEFPVFQRDVDEYAALYPDVNVIQELRNMRGWCLANPTRRKTKKGIRAFINTWLKKAQQEAAMKPDVPENPFLKYATGEADIGEFLL